MTDEEKLLTTVGARIKYLRLLLKMSQIEFAEALGIKQQRLSNYEKGERQIPQPLLEKLSQLWQINLHWLLTGEGKPVLQSTEAITDSTEAYVIPPRPGKQTVPGSFGWFENLPEDEQIGHVFKVMYRWSKEGKMLVYKTLAALLERSSDQ